MPSGALSCPICYNNYDQGEHTPRIIQECGHTICTKCLSVILLAKTVTAKCPLDNRKFSSLQQTIDAFPVNFTVHQLLDEKTARDFCAKHNEKLRLVCLTDKCEICDDCVFDGEHKSHDIRPIKKLKHDAGQKKAELETLLKDIDRENQGIKEVVEEKRTSLLNVVKEKFQELRWLLTKKELELSFEINSLFDLEYAAVRKDIGLSQETVDAIKKHIVTLDGVETPKEYFAVMTHDMFQGVRRTDLTLLHEQCQSLNQKLNKVAIHLHERLMSQISSLTNIEFSLDSLFDETNDSLIEGAKSEILNMSYGEQISKNLERMVRTEIKDDWLIISTENHPNKNFTSRNVNMNGPEWKKQDKVWLKLGKRQSMSECVQILARMWKSLGEVISVKIEFTSTEVTDKELLGVFSIVFGETIKLQEITINLSDCKVGDESIIPLVEEILPRMVNLKGLCLNLNATNITDASLGSFAKYMKPTLRILETFDIRLCETKVSDRSISQLFTRMERAKKFTLDLGYTEVSNECIQTLAAVTLPSMRVLEEFRLGLTKTNVTDEGLSHVFTEIETAKHLLLYLHGMNITDKSLELFARATLPALPGLEVLEMRLGETRISDQSMVQVLDNNLQSVRKFVLKLQSTKVSDKTAVKLVNTAYPAMKSLEEFEVDISGTEVTEKFAVQLSRMKARVCE